MLGPKTGAMMRHLRRENARQPFFSCKARTSVGYFWPLETRPMAANIGPRRRIFHFGGARPPAIFHFFHY